MQYVQPVGGGANAPYVNANPAGGVEGSAVPAGAIEYPQRELANLIADAGLAPSNADLTQVAKAVRTLMQKRSATAAAASGSADALTAAYSPAVTALTDRMKLTVVASTANTSTTPTFTPASGTIAAKTIVKGNNLPLEAGDIVGAAYPCELQYSLALDKWVLLNPAKGVSGFSFASNAEAQAFAVTTKPISPATLAAALQGGNQSLSAAGYQKLPGGLIMQWGVSANFSNSVTEDTYTSTFPIAFPNACLTAITTMHGNTAMDQTAHVDSLSTTQIVIRKNAIYTNATGTAYARWLAIGY